MSVQSSTPLLNRAPSSLRLRQQPLAEYQPLDFDREASQAAYQQFLRRDNAPNVSNVKASTAGTTSTAVSNGISLPSSEGTVSEKQAGTSSASSDYNPNEKTTNVTGAGRTYPTQPQGTAVPLEKSRPSILSPVADSSAPPLPPRDAIPQVDSGPRVDTLERPPSYPGEGRLTVNEEGRGKGKRKALPPVPADVPPQVSCLSLHATSFPLQFHLKWQYADWLIGTSTMAVSATPFSHLKILLPHAPNH